MNNLSQTVSIEELSKMSQEEYMRAKELANREYQKIIAAKDTYIWYPAALHKPLDNRDLRAKETAFMNSKYNNENYLTKCIMANNIAFASDESFINILIEKGYTFDNLIFLSKYFEKLGVLKDTVEQLELDQIKIASTGLKHIQRISRIMKKFFNISDYQLIINKITEVVVFQKDLFLESEKKLKKTK